MKQTESDARRGFWARMSDQERIRFIERRKQARVESHYGSGPQGPINLAKGVSRETS